MKGASGPVNRIKVRLRDGNTVELEGIPGLTLMEIIRDAGVSELLAICGGCCSCATCHVYVDRAWSDRLPALGEDENDLLEGSGHRLPTSRLACQVRFTESLAGITVTVPPES